MQIPDDSVANLGGYFDFVVDDLPRVGDSVSVVIPQRAPIPIHPVYRKYDPTANAWRTFLEDNDNRLASAPGSDGFCPPTSSSEYRSGLNTGDWCVRLTIKDGSVNDTDGAVNGSVSDPGGIGSLASVEVTGKSGGGSFDVFLLKGALFLLLLKVSQRKGVMAMLLLSMAATQASADERTTWYAGGQFGSAHTNVNSGEMRLGTMVSLHARAGAFYWDARYGTRNVDGQSVSRKDDGIDGLAGIGAQLHLFKRWSVGAELTRYGIDGDHIDFGGVDVMFRW